MSGAVPTREVAYRVFADEFDAASFTYAESDEERAPQYLVTPTGARVNRVFAVGVLTETEEVSDGVLRARIVDPTGAFVCYAGQYQPDALAFFEQASTPQFVALTGKARTFEPEDSEQVFTSLRPERVSEVDATTRDNWVVQTALYTLERTGLLAMALERDERGEALQARLEAAGAEPGLAAGIPHAIEVYEPTTGYLAAVQEMALDAVRVVAGEREEVAPVDLAPDEGGESEVLTGFSDVTLGSAPDTKATEAEPDVDEPEPEPDEDEPTTAGSEPAPETESTDSEAVAGTSETEPEPTGSQTEPEPTDSQTEPEPTDSQARTGAAETEAEPAAGDEEPEHGGPAGDSEPAQPEPADSATSAAETDPAELDADQEVDEEDLYELSEEERAEVHENYDVGFESGTEVESPDEPAASAAEEPPAEASDDPAEPPAGDAATADPEPAAPEPDEEETAAAEEYADAADLSEGEVQNRVVNTLKELGDGDGVPRGTLIETLQDRHGLSEGAIESAIEDALLGGRCFESGSDALKPI